MSNQKINNNIICESFPEDKCFSDEIMADENREIIHMKSINPLSQKKTKSKKGNKKPKMKEDDFYILTYAEHPKLLEYNYNVSQLKRLCKNYGLKISGNKNQLFKRVYDFLRQSVSSLQIQRIIRGYLLRKYLRMLGPALFPSQRSKCVNECDFYTLDSLREIPFYRFFSFKDEDDFIYGFDFCSLYNLIKSSTNGIQNPFNRKPIPSYISRKLRHLIYKARKYGYTVSIQLDVETNNTGLTNSHANTVDNELETNTPGNNEIMIDEPYIRQKTMSLFQQFDQLGFYTDLDWFMSLSAHSLRQFYRQLNDIWVYRANLSHDMKCMICPPYGNPFFTTYPLSANMNPHTDMELLVSKFCILEIGENLIKSIDNSNKWLGASYFLTALTLVNTNAAEAMPWLFEAGYSNNLV